MKQIILINTDSSDEEIRINKKYFYKVTRSLGESVCLNDHGVCIYYKIGETYTPSIAYSLLIGFRTKRQALIYVNTKPSLSLRLFRCLPLAPVVKIQRMSTDFSYEGFSEFWEDNQNDNRSKLKLNISTDWEKSAPDGTAGCSKIQVLAELKLFSRY
jgi:hypothetical protein